MSLHAVADISVTRADSDGWFVAQLKPNGLSMAVTHLGRQGFDTFAPWRLETSRRGRRLRGLRRLLFPGYLFVRATPRAGPWRAVQGTRGVARLVQTAQRGPSPLPAGFVDVLRARCNEEGRLIGAPCLAEGDRVRVVAGPFTDLAGRIEAMDEPARLRVLFSMMGREVRATVPAENLHPLR